MGIANYREVREALYYRESFVHGSCRAERRESLPGDRYPFDPKYHVWSYDTLVLTYDLNAHTVTYFDNRYYSITTSKLQTMIRAAFPVLQRDVYNARVIYDGDIS